MPTFHIGVVNEHFAASDDHECDDLEAARHSAIKGAIEIAADSVANGEPLFAAEVTIDIGGKRVARYIVSVGASRLKL